MNLKSKGYFYCKNFWRWCFWDLEESADSLYDAVEEQIILIVTDEHKFIIDIFGNFLEITLLFQYADENKIEIAWDDLAQWHPFVLRIDEFRKIVKAVSKQHNIPEWIPALLLFRFIGIDICEINTLSGLWENIIKQSQLFSQEEVEVLGKEISIRTWNCNKDWELNQKWNYATSLGWVFEGEDAYSLRVRENPTFPFAQWQNMMNKIEQEKN
jgi:hypothetical protein